MERSLIEVTDIKQFTYCPRIPFYRYCLPAVRPVTYGMEAGIRQHQVEQAHEERRTLRAYGMESGERVFNVALRSERLRLVGRLDMVIRREDEAVVVDYKLSSGRAGRHFQLQLAAYALLIEEAWKMPVRRAFLYHIPERKAEEVAMSAALRHGVERATAAIYRMVEDERMPPPPATRGQCVSCEFRRFCNDAV